MAGGRVGSHEVGMTDFTGATSLGNADLAMWNYTIQTPKVTEGTKHQIECRYIGVCGGP